MRYRGTISYRITEDHPDRKYFKGDISEILTFYDTYTIKEELSKELIMNHIKNDLALVAGGGYNTDHIRDVHFTIKEVIKDG